jgi:hypothetical protein
MPPSKHGASRTRTGDLLGAIQALSQLSYSPAVGKCSGGLFGGLIAEADHVAVLREQRRQLALAPL